MIAGSMKTLTTLAALLLASWLPPAWADGLEPFVASYEAYNEGKLAGNATMRVVHDAGSRWRIDLDITGSRGFAGLVRLNIDQSTVFDEIAGQYRPVSQSTVRKALLFGRKMVGTYDWNALSARWTGDLNAPR